MFLIRSLNRGGAERQLTLLARGFHQAGHDVGVAVFYAGGLFAATLQEAGIPLYDLGKKSRWDLGGFVLNLVQLVRRESPDILHSYLVEPNLLSVLVKPGLPSQTRVVWGVRASDMDLDHYHPVTKLTFGLTCRLSRFADRIIFNSEAGRVFHCERGYPAEKSVVVPNGIDVGGIFRPDIEAGQQVRQAWGIQPDQPLVGIAARLDPMKDHATFLRAAALVAAHMPETRFVCVGDGEPAMRQQLADLATSLGLDQRLIWAGPRDDMAAVFSALDLGVSSSAYGEGFSGVIGEGMACGLPFVATQVGDAARIIGETGSCVPPRNSEVMAAAIIARLTQLRQGADIVRQQTRERILTHFNTANLVTNTLQALEAMP
ncbi:MAG: glycosyltransferase [Magnetococcus sp. DMHC-1]|nr:glycosyltransferase [Magnetococcales bacterium]MBF0154095.1 glycosyltransferase [Magnetococcales bacterium]